MSAVEQESDWVDAPTGTTGGESESDWVDVQAPDNSVYHEPSNRVLGLPQTLDAREAQYVTDKEIDGKKDFYAMVPGNGQLPLPPLMEPPSIPEPATFGGTGRAIKDSAKGLVRGPANWVASLPSSAAGLALESAETAGVIKAGGGGSVNELQRNAMVDPLGGILTQIGLMLDDDKTMAAASQKIIDRNKRFLEESGLTKDGLSGFGKVFHDIGSGLASTAGAIGVSRLAKSVEAAAIFFAGIQKSQIYQESREASLAPGEASLTSSYAGVIEGALEKVGLDRLLPILKEYGPIKRFVRGGTVEWLQETAQGTGETVVTNIAGVRDQTLIQAAEDILYSGAIGFVSGGMTTSALGAFVKDKATQSGMSAEQADKLATYAMQNIEGISADLGTFLEKEVAPIAQDDASAKEFMTLLQKFNSGTDIDVGPLTPEQEASFKQWTEYFQQSLPGERGTAAVEAAWYKRSIKRGLDAEQAMTSAKLMGAYSGSAARATNQSPMEWWESVNLDLEVQRTPEDAMNSYQQKLDALNADLPDAPGPERIKPSEDLTQEEQSAKADEIAGFQKRLDDANYGTRDTSMKKPLINYLRSVGGINPDGVAAQELRHLGINSKMAPGLYRRQETALSDLDRIPVEEFRNATGIVAPGDGTYGNYVDRDWLLEKLRDEQFGERIGQERPEGDESFLQALDKAGLDYRTATAEQVYEALGADGDIVVAAADMGVELTPKEVRQVRGIMERNPDMYVQDAIDDFVERSIIMGDTRYQRDSEQGVIPGAEKATDKQVAEKGMEGRLKPTKAQKPMDEGMFGDAFKQQTLFQSYQRVQTLQRMYDYDLLDKLKTLEGYKGEANKAKREAFLERAQTNTLTEADLALKKDVVDAAKRVGGRLYQAQSITDTESFKKWFADSKVVDENGKPLRMYRGDYRGDKMGESFRTIRTDEDGSGAIYFTDKPDIASGYSTNKPYYDGAFDDVLMHTQVKIKGKLLPLSRANAYLTQAQRQKIEDVVLTIGEREDGSGRFYSGPGADDPVIGKRTWQDYLQRSAGNYVKAADELLAKGGTLDVTEYIDFWKGIGIFDNFMFDDPTEARSTVTPVYLSIKNPLDIYAVSAKELAAIKKVVPENDQTMQSLEWAIEKNQPRTMSFVTPEFRDGLESLGYDGVKDIGGRQMGEADHTVYMAFESSQVKSVFNKGTFDAGDPRILFQEGALGAITFGRDKTLIQLFQNANPSTLLHELGHFFLRDMDRIAKSTRRPMVKKDFEAVKKWLGSKDGKFTEAQEEKFARGFEAYLREGNAPVESLKPVFARFKDWLTSIYKSVKDLNVEINDDVRQVFDRMLGADYAGQEKAAQQSEIDAMEAMYAQARKTEPENTFWRDTNSIFQNISDIGADIFTPITSRLERISPKLKHAVRRFTVMTDLHTQQDKTAAEGFIKIVADKMEKPDYYEFALALNNRNDVVVDRIMKKYGAEKEWESVRNRLDDIFNQAAEVGLDMGYLENYFPRLVRRNMELEYMAFLRTQPQWTELQQALSDADPTNTFTPQEQAEFANKFLRGFTSQHLNVKRPGFTKERNIDVVTNEMQRFYEPPVEALINYISGMRFAIEARQLLGQSEKKLDDSIGKYVLGLAEQGIITPKQEQEIKRILKAILEPVGPGIAVSWIKSIGYIYTMGTSPSSTITQIGDLAFSLARNGYYRTGKAFINAAVRQSEFTQKEVGIDAILDEYKDKSRASKFLNYNFKRIGLRGFDMITSETQMNASIDRLRAQLKKGGKAATKQMEVIFGDQAPRVIEELMSGQKTEDTLYLAASELLDVAPKAHSELPVGYLRGGNWRMMYMLKTYTFRQIDIYRREVFSKIASGDKEQMIQGTRNLIHLAVGLMLMGMTSDALKDLLFGREVTYRELVIDNLIKLAGITKYQIYKTRQDGIIEGIILSTVIPAALWAPADDLWRDVDKISSGKRAAKDSEILGHIPFIGKLYYWWWGGGRTKEEKKAGTAGKGGKTKETW